MSDQNRKSIFSLFPNYESKLGDWETTEEEKPKIIALETLNDIQKTSTQQNFIVKVSLNKFIGNNQLVVEVDEKSFSTYQKSTNIEELNTFFSDVFVDFSSVVRIDENFKLTAKVIDLSTNQIIDSKITTIKVASNGNAKKSNESVEQLKNKIEINQSINFEFFIDNYNTHFGEINKIKEDSIINVLKGVEKYYLSENKKIDKYRLSYMLATIQHETGGTFNPVEEANWLKWESRKKYFEKMYDPILGNPEKRKKMALDNGNTEAGDGVKYFGRGYVQITWKNNYQKMKDKFGIDLVNFPSLALENELAMNILIFGSETGFFTGVKLEKYISNEKKDYFNARKVINGLDKAKTIENYANKIEKCIKLQE